MRRCAWPPVCQRRHRRRLGHQHPDLPHTIHCWIVDIGRNDVAFHRRHAAQGHVFTDGRNGVGDSFRHGLAVNIGTRQAFHDDTPSAPCNLATMPWKSAFFATKSVSEFTSTSHPFAAIYGQGHQPFGSSAARFFRRLRQPLRAQPVHAASISPSVSVRAFLASIIPAPDLSRRFLPMQR